MSGRFVGVAEFGELVVEVLDPLFEEFDDLLDVAADAGPEGRFEMVFLLRDQIDQLSAASDEALQIPLVFRLLFAEDEVFGMLGIAGQEPGVEGIGLGEPAHAAGEIADARGKDDSDGIALLDQKVDERDMIGSGRFEDDLTLLRRWQVGAKFLKPGRIVGKAFDGGVVGCGDIQVGFGDIDPEVKKGGVGVHGVPVS